MDVWSDMKAHLAELERKSLRRHGVVVESPLDAHVTIAGTRMVCLCSNNYLGLANHPEVTAAAADAARRWGVGAGASRLLGGTTSLHVQLQNALARFEGREAALVTSSGWQANACAVAALAGEGDLIVCDKLNHASILDAARASGAMFRTYVHGQTDRLTALLDRLRASHRRCVIITDGVFSMDGDVARLADLVDAKNRYEALLVVDEAHGTGVLGANGRGAAEAAGVEEHVDVVVGTLSKALGGLGGFIAGRHVLIETLINTARPYIYTTALPAPLCAAAMAALEIVRREPARRQKVLSQAQRLRDLLRGRGLDVGGSTTQIVPVIAGYPQQALDLSRRCFEAGFYVPAVRPPSVAPHVSRLRASVLATHDWADLERFADVVAG